MPSGAVEITEPCVLPPSETRTWLDHDRPPSSLRRSRIGLALNEMLVQVVYARLAYGLDGVRSHAVHSLSANGNPIGLLRIVNGPSQVWPPSSVTYENRPCGWYAPVNDRQT